MTSTRTGFPFKPEKLSDAELAEIRQRIETYRARPSDAAALLLDRDARMPEMEAQLAEYRELWAATLDEASAIKEYQIIKTCAPNAKSEAVIEAFERCMKAVDRRRSVMDRLTNTDSQTDPTRTPATTARAS